MATLVFNQSCAALFSVVSRRLRIISLILSLSEATSPAASTVIERDRSHFVTAVATSAMARTCVGEICGKPVHVVRQIAPRSGRSGHVRLPAELAFDADLAGDGRDLIGECRERVNHFVDRFGQFRNLAFGFQNQFAFQIAVRDVCHDLGNTAHLIGQVAGHEIDVVRQVFPCSGNPSTSAWPPSFPSVPTSRATRVTSEAKELSWSTMVLTVFFSSRISP